MSGSLSPQGSASLPTGAPALRRFLTSAFLVIRSSRSLLVRFLT